MGTSFSSDRQHGSCPDIQCCKERKSGFSMVVKNDSSGKKFSSRAMSLPNISLRERSPAETPDSSIKHVQVPSWKRPPEPMEGWTVKEQQILIDDLDSNPHARNHHGHLERVFERTHRALPDKTLKQIEQCYHHLQAKRIAYFGPSVKIKDETFEKQSSSLSRRSSQSSNGGVFSRGPKGSRRTSA